MNKCVVFDNGKFKFLRSLVFNYNLNKSNGYMETWGKTRDEDPEFCPFGPVIADIEITTICGGVDPKFGPCKFCYKANTLKGNNMSFENFKTIFDKLPKTLTQIAFGTDATLTSNPDIWKIMQYSRDNGVMPNVTVANIDKGTAEKLSKLCGVVDVSNYGEIFGKQYCFDSVKNLTDTGMKQVNIHQLLSSETYQQCLDLLDSRVKDERLEKLNAIVFLSLKQKGRGINYHPMTQDQFNVIVDKAFELGVSIGFDSCSSLKVFNYLKNKNDKQDLTQFIEPCESSLFSMYVNVEGKYFPCSFTEGEQEWKEGLDILNCDDFIKDIWYHEKTKTFRAKLLNTQKTNCHNCRHCPMFKI